MGRLSLLDIINAKIIKFAFLKTATNPFSDQLKCKHMEEIKINNVTQQGYRGEKSYFPFGTRAKWEITRGLRRKRS